MTREEYEKLSAALLKDFAKKRGIRGVSAMRKSEVASLLAEADSAALAQGQQVPEAKAPERGEAESSPAAEEKTVKGSAGAKKKETV